MNEEVVNRVAPNVTQAKIGDCMDEMVLRSLGVQNFDACFVCTSEEFQASLEITSLLKELGASLVISKSDYGLHSRLLKKIGADEVIFPEYDMAFRTAMRFSVNGALEYIELSPGYGIFELDVPDSWAGKTITDLDIRKKYNVNIIGIKKDGAVTPITSGDHVFLAEDHIVLAGSNEDVIRMTK
jgi:trk system potassium uptake protein TrkA